MSQVSSAADLTAAIRRTTGERPPPLVGCSVTLVGNSIYVFGGRLVPTRTMVSTLYRLDLKTLVWKKIPSNPTTTGNSTSSSRRPSRTEEETSFDDPSETTTETSKNTRFRTTPPQARYFHSACAWNDKLVVFGGEGYHETTTTLTSTTSYATSSPSISRSTSPSNSPTVSISNLSSPPAQQQQQTQQQEQTSTTEDSPAPTLETLDDLQIFDTTLERWLELPSLKLGTGVVERPKPRYAHLGVVCTGWTSFVDGEEERKKGEERNGHGTEKKEEEEREKSCLLIMGGQDVRNTYLHSTDILDLETLTWISTGKWDRHIGTYRAVATTASLTVHPQSTFESMNVVQEGEGGGGRKEELIELSWSEKVKLEDPEPLLLFSNFNFTQVRRDLDLLSSPLSSNSPLTPTSLSPHMIGLPSLPPGLRFPSGFQIGGWLVIFGTFLSQHVNHFSIWALDLGSSTTTTQSSSTTTTLKGKGSITRSIESKIQENGRGGLEWIRIDPGNVLQKGSWNRAVGWGNNVVVLGDRERDIAADYDHRQTNFTHVAFVDLEAHGVYQPPPRSLPPIAQSFGLLSLSQPSLSGFEIICSDGKRLACSRKILEDRWTWFRSKVEEFKVRASGVVAAQQKRNNDVQAENSDVGSLAGDHQSTTSTGGGGGGTNVKNSPVVDTHSSSARSLAPTTGTGGTDEARLTPRTLSLPEPSPVVLAFLQYLYTLNLCTSLQLSLPILSSLLVFSRSYDRGGDDTLRALVVHALHTLLSNDPKCAPGVYEAATLGGCTALQIRALKALMTSPRNLGQVQSGGSNASQGMTRTGSQGETRRSTRPSAPSSSSSSPASFSRPTNPTSFNHPTLSAPQSSTITDTDHPSVNASTPSPHSSIQARRASTSSSVAIPTPDNVAPTPVPLWTTFSPPVVSPTQTSIANRHVEPSSPLPLTPSTTPQDSSIFFGSPQSQSQSRSRSTSLNTSIRSRSSSNASQAHSVSKLGLGQPSSSTISVPPPLSTSGGWGHALETQEEVDETTISPVVTRTNDPETNSSSLAVVDDCGTTVRREEEDGEYTAKLNRSDSGRRRFSFGSIVRPHGRLSKKDERGERKKEEEEVWQPIFLDSVRMKGTESNPLSKRKATPITLEHLARLEESEASQTRVTDDEETRSSTLSPHSTRFELSPPRSSSSIGLYPEPSLPARSPLLQQSFLSSPSSASIRTSSSQSSIPMSRLPSSSSGHSLSSHEGSDLVTPPMPSTSRFEPAVVHSSPSSPLLSLSPVHSTGPVSKESASSSILLGNSNRSQASLSPPSSPPSFTAPPRRTSLLPSFHRSSTSSKQQRHQLEVELGAKLLRAAGASAKEVQLRSKNVGWQILKAKEAGDYSKLPPALLVGGNVESTAIVVERFIGGEQLSSKFSID